jgi:hypothetical protein
VQQQQQRTTITNNEQQQRTTTTNNNNNSNDNNSNQHNDNKQQQQQQQQATSTKGAQHEHGVSLLPLAIRRACVSGVTWALSTDTVVVALQTFKSLERRTAAALVLRRGRGGTSGGNTGWCRGAARYWHTRFYRHKFAVHRTLHRDAPLCFKGVIYPRTVE